MGRRPVGNVTHAATGRTFFAFALLPVVMAGLVPAIHVFEHSFEHCKAKTWMPGTRPGMTSQLKRRTNTRTLEAPNFGFGLRAAEIVEQAGRLR